MTRTVVWLCVTLGGTDMVGCDLGYTHVVQECAHLDFASAF